MTTARQSSTTNDGRQAKPARKRALKAVPKTGAKAEPRKHTYNTSPKSKRGPEYKFLYPKPFADIRTITPDMAAVWMDANEHNRRIRNASVNGWSVDMSAGSWKVTNQGIGFTKSGRLVDGQHRLLGVLHSGESIESTIVFGLDEDVQPVIDIGLQRSLADTLSTRLRPDGQPEKDVSKLGSVLRRVYLWKLRMERTETLEKLGIEIMQDSRSAASKEEANLHFQRQPANVAYLLRGGMKITNTQLLKLLDSPEGDAIRHATMKGRHAQQELHISAAVLGTAYYLFAKLDADLADEFWEALMYGDGMVPGDPIRALRRAIGAIADGKGPKRYVREEVKLAMLCKAWNAWNDGETMDVCSWRATGRAPEPFPVPRLGLD